MFILMNLNHYKTIDKFNIIIGVKEKVYITVHIYQRKSTNQIVRYDYENEKQYAHYHWENRLSLKEKIKNKKKYYIDKYGYETARGTYSSHLAPLDGIYIKKAKIK